jgi:hypothetical protein
MRGTLTLQEARDRGREQVESVTRLMNLGGVPLVEWEGNICRPLSYEERVRIWSAMTGRQR